MDHGDLDHGFARLGQPLVIFAVTPISAKPRKRSLHNPSLRQYHPAFDSNRSKHRLDCPTERIPHPRRQGVSSVSRVPPDQAKATIPSLHAREYKACSILVRQRRREHHHPQEQPHRVDHHVTLSASDFLGSIVASFSPHLCCLDALAVDDADARRCLSACFPPHLATKSIVDSIPDAKVSPVAKETVHRAPIRKLLGKHPPLTTGFGQVEDRVNYRSPIDRLRRPHLTRRRQHRPDELPLLIRQVREILRSFHGYGSILWSDNLMESYPLMNKCAIQKQALKELKTLRPHKWAGIYYLGDGLGVNISLSIAPKTGYLFEWRGCLALYDRNYGNVTEKDDRVRIDFTLNNNSKDSKTLPSEFFIVNWGPRHYLIPADEMIDFCNFVNNGMEPRSDIHGMFLLRKGDEKLSVTGLPTLPKEYRDYLLTAPVEADIIEVNDTKSDFDADDFGSKDTVVTLNKGTNDKLRVGMELRVIKPEDLFSTSVKITEVAADHSKALLTQYDKDSESPQIGWKLSTRTH